MSNNTMKTTSTYTVGKTIINEQGERQVVYEKRLVAVTLTAHEQGVFWKGARVA